MSNGIPNFQMLRDAKVEITAHVDSTNAPIAIARINDQYEHRFSANSRISKALLQMSTQELSTRLTGGQFFFIGDELVDFRDGEYAGFIHGDDSIMKLFEVVGFSEKKKNQKANNTASNNVLLSNVWSKHDIIVPQYNDGGDFSSELSFTWNPFQKDVHSAFKLVRLICTNGMVGLTEFLNTRVPIVNRWEEHLEIASRQIQNKVEDKVAARLGEMGSEMATVGELMKLQDHVDNRLQNGNVIDQQSREKLRNISKVISPQLHLGKVYKDSVFSDRRLGAQMPAHLTTIDTYNIITEVNSHTEETSGSSSNALDKMANAIVFDREDLTHHASRFDNRLGSPFSNPDQAFFGDIKD